MFKNSIMLWDVVFYMSHLEIFLKINIWFIQKKEILQKAQLHLGRVNQGKCTYSVRSLICLCIQVGRGTTFRNRFSTWSVAVGTEPALEERDEIKWSL